MLATSPSLLIVMFFCFSLFNFGYSSPICGSTPHGLLHEKQVQKHQNHQTNNQDLVMNIICNPNKTLAKLTCNIETKTNNITLIISTNSPR